MPIGNSMNREKKREEVIVKDRLLQKVLELNDLDNEELDVSLFDSS